MEFALTIFLILCALGCLWTFGRSYRIYEYPGFMTFAFMVFIVPQAISLTRFPGAALPRSVEAVLWMSCLCLGACFLGYRARPLAFVHRVAMVSARESRLLLGGAVFLLIACAFGALIGRMSPEETGGSMWSGKVTIYQFFTGAIFPAVAIFLRHALRRKSVLGWVLFGLAMIPPLQAMIFAGRREATSQIFLTIGLVLFFERYVTPPRWLTPVVAAAAMLIIPATGSYRSIAVTGDWGNLWKLDLLENFKEFLQSESVLELRNAAVTIQATERLGTYGWGAGYWDEVVWRFVPAQIVGADLKIWLMIARDSELYDQVFASMGFAVSVGSTLTGMADAFREFGYFGALVFALIGLFFRTLWTAACRPGAVFGQLVYIGTVTSAMRAVTHQTVDFLPGLIYQLIFIGILYFFARQPKSAARRNKTRQGPPLISSLPQTEQSK